MMNRSTCCLPIFITMMLLGTNCAWAQNPLIMDQFTADPTARVFEGKIYVYPSHDIPVPPGSGARKNWFCMEDYHVFSSENLTDWTDHGVILTQTQVPWLQRKSYSMWAPDCVFKNGKYYFYFPTGGRIGVAIADKPYGPFKPEEQPIAGVRGIDPGVLIDKDGSAYLFWSGIMMAKLKDTMIELDSQPQWVQNLPRPGLIEGPFPFERKGIYYLTYPHVHNKTERLEYSIASSPMGPYQWKGVIMDETPSGCWTNHHSIVNYKGQWYLFYHDKQLSPNFDKNRSIKADTLSFNDDGTIQKVIPTLRGVGNSDARKDIQIDRYSAISKEGTSVSFLNKDNTFEGWKTVLAKPNAWVRYNRVDFGDKPLSSVKIRASSVAGGTIAIHKGTAEGPLIAQVKVPPTTDWDLVSSMLTGAPAGLQDLSVVLTEGGPVEIDWIQFE